MRKVLIVGAGQAGLMLALGLQESGYQVTVMSDRTPDEIRGGRVMSTQLMFDHALGLERAQGLNLWERQAPRVRGMGMAVGGPDGVPVVEWVGRLDAFAQSVDQRVKMPAWMELFAERGGNLVIHGVSVTDLDWYASRYDLVIVAAGKGELVQLFDRDASRSPYTRPMRALAAVYLHGVHPLADAPVSTARCNNVPGVGELYFMPSFTRSGPCEIAFFEALPDGPMDRFAGIRDPREHHSLTLELIREYVPWEFERVKDSEPTDAGGVLAGRYPPTVRRPVGELPGGGIVLGVADVVVANDPITGQGANGAARSAAHHLNAILAHGDRAFDRAWMEGTFEALWDAYSSHSTRWTNAMLAPPPEHAVALLGSAAEYQAVADRFANAFNDPADLDVWFFDPDRAAAFLAEQRAGA